MPCQESVSIANARRWVRHIPFTPLSRATDVIHIHRSIQPFDKCYRVPWLNKIMCHRVPWVKCKLLKKAFPFVSLMRCFETSNICLSVSDYIFPCHCYKMSLLDSTSFSQVHPWTVNLYTDLIWQLILSLSPVECWYFLPQVQDAGNRRRRGSVASHNFIISCPHSQSQRL